MEVQENQKKDASIVAALEALLFIYGEPLEIIKILKILKQQSADLDEAVVKTALQTLQAQLESDERGLSLMVHDRQAQLVTKPGFKGLLQEIVKEELHEALTGAALETLAIISYAGPVPRSTIDYIRGVNSTFILRNLLLRGLIDRSQDPNRANTYIYKASFEFLRYLGLSKVNDLPEYQKFREVVEKFQVED